ncbi:hypothetical protein A0J52_06860 [Clostridium sporogenes]|uniref:DUF2971 domain-containing protein n=2 Tax=Clostridium sporogenes TaxID=1509 RepID=UPI00077FF7FF|nr:DUF2971 domain-containing protein [Clostridium sporogenes]KYN78990.1 hypothetical protein A0J52_06860 [Clostridium sporogenes]MBW5459316.1 DUF2971 domain-containing protein [Clostridium sporogenes]
MIGYYYCSLSTFLNILKSKQIYLSDPLKMNDNLEIKWYLDRLNDEKSNANEFESVFDMMKMRSNIDFTFEELVKCLNSKGQRSIYICCFSKESDILSQWRAYAEDGKGVSIGFDLEKLKIADNLLIREIIYENNIVQGEIENDVEIVADEMGTVLKDHKITIKEEQIDVFLHELIPELAKYKNPAFSEEKEIRLIYCDDMKFEKIVDSYGAFQEKWELIELKHDFRVIESNNITEFVKLDFDPDSIEEICIGPKCLLSKNDIKHILKKLLGVEKDVIESKSSYR